MSKIKAIITLCNLKEKEITKLKQEISNLESILGNKVRQIDLCKQEIEKESNSLESDFKLFDYFYKFKQKKQDTIHKIHQEVVLMEQKVKELQERLYGEFRELKSYEKILEINRERGKSLQQEIEEKTLEDLTSIIFNTKSKI